MSKRSKDRTVRGMFLLVCGALLGAGLWTLAPSQSLQAQNMPDPVDAPDPEPIPELPLLLEPIEGLTTLIHPAPDETGVPIGTALFFRQPAPADAEVVWVGAVEIDRTTTESTAECRPVTLGDAVVHAIVYASDGTMIEDNKCTLHVMNIPLEEIKVGPVVPTVGAVDFDEDSSFDVTWQYFSGESIAKLTQLVDPFAGTDRRFGKPRPKGSHRYATSVGRTVTLNATIDPIEYAPLMAWRVAGLAERLVPQTSQAFNNVGTQVIEYGPLDNPAWITIETYNVEIISHATSEDIIPEGEPITFTAVTDPPGYEDEIMWLSSTKYGTGSAVAGTGPSFTVQFDDTFGIDDDFQWLGVKADNASFGQDQKPLRTCPIDLCDPGFTCFGEYEADEGGVLTKFLGFG